MKNNQSIATYARYSSENQNDKSIDDQIRKCDEKIHALFGSSSKIQRFEDRAMSGTRLDRPGYQDMLKAALDNEFQVLVVDDLSRLSRNNSEAQRLLAEFKFYGIRIIAVADGIDTIERGYKLQAGLRAIMNEEYIDALADKTFRGLEGRAYEGKFCGGGAYGYKSVCIDANNPKLGTKLEIIPKEEKWVKQIFTMYADGYSPKAIASYLNGLGIPAPRKSKNGKQNKWCATAIYGDMKAFTGMLNNPLYRGQSVWNRRKWVKNPITGRKVPRLNDESKWIIKDMPELRIIDESLWQRVKARQMSVRTKSKKLQAALHKYARTGRGPKYLFSGILKCGVCGGNYAIRNKTTYACSTHTNKGEHACNNKLAVKKELVESKIFASLKDILFTEENIKLFEQEARQLLIKAFKERNNTKDVDKDNLAKIHFEIENIVNAIASGLISDVLKSRLESLESEKQKLEARMKVDTSELNRINDFIPEITNNFKQIVEGHKTITIEHVAKLRSKLGMLLDNEVRLYPENDNKSLYGEIQGNYLNLLKLSGVSPGSVSVVAGAGFEPTTFRL